MIDYGHIKSLIRDPRKAITGFIMVSPLWNSLDDETYLKRIYKLRFGKNLDLDNPKTYSEKLQWIKLYDRRDEYIRIVDKIEAKDYVAQKIGSQYIIPTIAIWDNPNEIDFDNLPDQFVLKCNHDSGGLVICTDKRSLNQKKVKKRLEAALNHDFYLVGREWPYKGIRRRILAEQFMMDSALGELRDYKFFTFNGEAKLLFIATDRNEKNKETCFDFFDMDFNHLDIINGHRNADVIPQKPQCFDEMRYLAEKLSTGFPELRVDFYEVNGKVFFGEMTLFHWSGLVPYTPSSWDEKMGSWIQLPR